MNANAATPDNHNVRYWPKRTYRVALHMSAFGGKADMIQGKADMLGLRADMHYAAAPHK